MADRGSRVKIKLRSTESPYTYHSFKNKRNHPARLELRKYDPTLKRHVLFREER